MPTLKTTKRIRVACLIADTTGEERCTSHSSRLARLTGAVNAIYGALADNNPDHHVILVAPEYYFSRKSMARTDYNGQQFMAIDVDKMAHRNGPDDFSESADMEETEDARRKPAYSEKQFRAITRELCALTTGKHNLLLVPGTTLWREYVYFKNLRGIPSPTRNTCQAFANGQIVCEFSKTENAAETAVDPRLGMTRAMRDQRYLFTAGAGHGQFNRWDIKFGLEICADHNNGGTLKQNLPTPDDWVDIHILVSAGQFVQPASAAADNGGLIIHNDGSRTDQSQTVNRIARGIGALATLTTENLFGEMAGCKVWEVNIDLER